MLRFGKAPASIAQVVLLLLLLGSGAQIALAASGNTATPAAPAPSPAFHFYKPVFYVMALATDQPTAARIEVESAKQLLERKDGIKFNNDAYTIISAPTSWGIPDIVSQCANTPDATLGALVYFNVFSESASTSYLAVTKSKFQLDSDAALIECTNFGTMNVLWTTNEQSGSDSGASVTLLPLAAIGSAFQSFLTSHTQSTMTQTTYASPVPIPPAYTSQSTLTVGSNALATSGQAVALGFLSSFSNTNAAATLPGNNPDSIARGAAARLARRVLDELSKEKSSALAPSGRPCERCDDWFITPSPSPSPSAGIPAQDPTANPTPAPTHTATSTPSSKYDPWPAVSPSATIDQINQFLSAYSGTRTTTQQKHSIVVVQKQAYSMSLTGMLLSIVRIDTSQRFDIGGTPVCFDAPQTTRTYTMPVSAVSVTVPVSAASVTGLPNIARFSGREIRLTKALEPATCVISVPVEYENILDDPYPEPTHVDISVDSDFSARYLQRLATSFLKGLEPKLGLPLGRPVKSK